MDFLVHVYYDLVDEEGKVIGSGDTAEVATIEYKEEWKEYIDGLKDEIHSKESREYILRIDEVIIKNISMIKFKK